MIRLKDAFFFRDDGTITNVVERRHTHKKKSELHLIQFMLPDEEYKTNCMPAKWFRLPDTRIEHL